MLATAYTKRVVSDFYRDLLFFLSPWSTGFGRSHHRVQRCHATRFIYVCTKKPPNRSLAPSFRPPRLSSSTFAPCTLAARSSCIYFFIFLLPPSLSQPINI